MSVQAAIAAFRSAWTEPEVDSVDFAKRQDYFRLLYGYYQNSAFESLSRWEAYRQANGPLYRNIRSIYNPTRRLVNFYVSQVYPGVLSEDASALPDGVQLAIPLAKDTPDELRMAIAQFWQWSNWQSGNKIMVRYGAVTGSSLVELIDDRERGKIGASARWPGLIESHTLDSVGNLKAYALEYNTEDADGNSYVYRKEVDKESFRYFRDDKPFTPDGKLAPEEENVYGFVPAVFCKHIDEGGDWGAPAIAGSISKIDEINGLASHSHDHVERAIEAPGLIASDGKVGRIGEDRTKKTHDEYSSVADTKEKNARLLILKGPADAKWYSMVPGLDPEKVVPLIQEQLREIEHDFPELSMYTELRKMSQVTGPGAARMMGDVGGRVLEVASNYDQQSIKLFQMATAIGGMRLREGREGWRNATPQQRKFGDFDLTSYARGELDFAILPRPLVPMTEADQIELTGKRLDNASKAGGVGYDPDSVLRIAGEGDEKERLRIINARAGVKPTSDEV